MSKNAMEPETGELNSDPGLAGHIAEQNSNPTRNKDAVGP